jgi:hypothetical protein
LVVTGEQRAGLTDLVLGRMIKEFSGTQITIGNPHCQFRTFKSLRCCSAAFNKCARSVKIGSRLDGLSAGSFEHGLRALAGSLGCTKALTSFPTATRVKKRRWSR